MDLIDTHCHLDVAAFDADRAQVLKRCHEKGVTRMVIPAVTAAGWDGLCMLCKQEVGLYPALGLHPVYVEKHQDEDLDSLKGLLMHERPVAVGEIGLDYYLTHLDRERQQTLFEKQLGLARDANLPVILHVRKAHDQVLSTLKKIPVSGGVCHAFNGSLQQAQQYIDLGFKLGFGGMLTYTGSTKLRALAQALPLSALVLETDAPDMTVASHRGERNSPEYLPECLNAFSEIRDEDLHVIARQTTQNAEQVFSL